MSKHLIIGLGGTGGKVICELRKRIYEDYRTLNPKSEDALLGDIDLPVIDYLYVDSSKADLEGKDKEGRDIPAYYNMWQTLGHSVALDPVQRLFIGGMERVKLDNLHQYNNLNSFYTDQDKEDTAKSLDAIIGDGIGGQRRRFGRMLFSDSCMRNPNFKTALLSRVNAILAEGKQRGDNAGNVTFHICAGLGGGTGSGTIVDVLSQVRKMFPQNGRDDQYRICLYLYIPEELDSPFDSQGFYRPNGYAALTELNAVSVGEYKPIDIANNKDLPADEKRINDAGFNIAYIYTNRNFVGNQYSLEQLPKIASDFLYQKLMTGISSRFETNENSGAGPEECDGAPVRSRKFLTFGIKRLIYPEIEIHEYATYKFAYTSAMQMVWGWPKGAAYPVELQDDQISVSSNEIKGNDDHFQMRQTLSMTDSLFTLDTKYFDRYASNSDNWRPIIDTWQQVTDRWYNALVGADRRYWISKFNQEVGEMFTKGFRGHGVKNYYINCKNDKTYLAQETVDKVGNYLMQEWTQGRRSLAEVDKFLDILIEDSKERVVRYDKKIGDCTNAMNKAVGNCNKLARNLNDIGVISDALFGLARRNFGQYKEQMRERYINQTLIEANTFAKELISVVIDGLNALKDSVDTTLNAMKQYIQDMNDIAAAKCQDGDGGYRPDSEVVKIYEPDEVRNLVDTFIHKEERMKTDTADLYAKISGITHDGGHFKEFAKNYPTSESLRVLLENSSRESARNRMDDYAIENKGQKILQTNVLEKLQQRTDWADVVTKLCNDALILVEPNNNEIDADRLASRMVQFGLPEYPGNESFRNSVIKKVSDIFEGQGYPKPIPYTTPNSQLVLVTGLSSIPVRYVRSVASLKERYDEFVKKEKSNKKLVHSETFAQPLPSLYNKSQQELKDELYRILLLCYCIDGILKEEINQDTGERINAVAAKLRGDSPYCYNRNDLPNEVPSGFIFFGKTVRDSMERLSRREGDVRLLTKLIQEQLKDKYRHNDAKEGLAETIKKFLKDVIMPEYDNNVMEKEVQTYSKVVDSIVETDLAIK
ncbi:MAG: tubulin-like doman-containing protein [Paludibacteraceae bacterium]|nr:tubulin-like doman-containing protein [Paludibacteraceae bacterium]